MVITQVHKMHNYKDHKYTYIKYTYVDHKYYYLLLLQDIYRALQYVKNITQRLTYFVYNMLEQFMPMVKVT